LKKVDINGDILSTIPRENVYAVTTPQIFNKAKYVQALNKAIKRNADYTDDCQIIEGIYGKIKIVDIGYENIKITTPIDLTLAKAILKDREKREENENW
jgi:2-C-methyl-D-erythritol 4-phosphate cytidylyltransferase